jgi:hypothetical protein
MPVRLSNRFAAKYRGLPESLKLKVDKALKMLDADFRHPGLHSHPLGSAPGIYEVYVDRKYRMTYERRGDLFFMRNVDNYDECLKNP